MIEIVKLLPQLLPSPAPSPSANTTAVQSQQQQQQQQQQEEVVVEAAACLETPLAVCAGPDELCYLDPSCSSPSSTASSLGCNAGGKGQNCRFCGFGSYAACPSSPTATASVSATSALDTTGLQKEAQGQKVWNKDLKSFSLPEVDPKSLHLWR